MSFFDKIKDVLTIPDEDDFEDENEINEEDEAEPAPKKKPFESPAYKKPDPQPRVFQGGKSAKTISFNQSQMQVVLVKPERFEDVPPIADHLNEKKTVVLNLENANRDESRRIVDFLSGVTYANRGNIKKIAKQTFILVPIDVDVTGELMLDDFEEGNIYF